MNLIRPLAAAMLVTGMALPVALADLPGAGVKPVVELVEQLEKQGYSPFIEISFDDGNWEVEVYKNDEPFELAIDAHSGTTLSEHRDDAEPRPPRDAQKLSQILRTIMEAGYSNIDEVSFERRYWEIEAFRDGGKHEIHVHPATGEVINSRRED